MTDKIKYECENCEVVIEGTIGDPYEAPVLRCPDCGDRLSEMFNQS